VIKTATTIARPKLAPIIAPMVIVSGREEAATGLGIDVGLSSTLLVEVEMQEVSFPLKT